MFCGNPSINGSWELCKEVNQGICIRNNVSGNVGVAERDDGTAKHFDAVFISSHIPSAGILGLECWVNARSVTWRSDNVPTEKEEKENVKDEGGDHLHPHPYILPRDALPIGFVHPAP